MSLLRTIEGALNFIPVVGPTVSGLLSTSTTSDPSTGRVSQADFYAQRDAYYAQITAAYGAPVHTQLAGNPFAVFSHSVIKDSPFKNYAPELAALVEKMKRYYPELMGLPSAPVVKAPGSAPESPAPDETKSNGSGNMPGWLWIAAGVGALLFFKNKRR
jgi:hypothetical protein